MALETVTGGIALVVGRILYGGVLGFMGLNHFMDLDNMTGYAESKGVPAPKIAVAGSGAVLVLGGLSVVLGAFSGVGSVLLIGFFVVVTPKMHDFWNFEGEEKQNQMINFLKNVALLGGALVFLDLSAATWKFAVGVGLV